MVDDLHRPRPFSQWHEDHGNALWWLFPISEPPYVGTPLDLGRSLSVDVTLGFETVTVKGEMMGGWPFEPEDERNLWWTPLPDAHHINDQIPV